MVASTNADVANDAYSLATFASRAEQKPTPTRDDAFVDAARDAHRASDRSMRDASPPSRARATVERSASDAMVASPASARDAEAANSAVVDVDEDIDEDDERAYAMGAEDEDGGSSFKSRTTGERWTRYYEHEREAYFYVHATTHETSWDHPDSDEYLAEKAARHTVAAQKTLNAALNAHDEKIDTKFTKLCIVNERWLEKYPPAVPIPTRPKDFKGVYGAEDEFWDPEGDSYSIDNNEGSERGDNMFVDAYDAEDSLARVTSAVDLATPEDLRPLAVARAYLDLALDLAVDLVDDDDNHARAKVIAEAAKAAEAEKLKDGPQVSLTRRGVKLSPTLSASSKRGSLKSSRSVKQQNIIVAQTNADEPSELTMRDAFERMRAKYRNTIGDARLTFKNDGAADDVEDAIFSRRLHAPYDHVISTGLHIEDFTHASDEDEDEDKRSEYSDSEFTARKDRASPHFSKLKAPSSAEQDEEDARIQAEGEAEYAAAQKIKEEDIRERRGLIARLTKTLSKASREKRAAKRRAKKDAKQLAAVGYVAPWEKNKAARAVERVDTGASDTESDKDVGAAA